MCDNITLSKVLDDKIDDLVMTINNLSDSILKKNDMYYENSSLQKTLSEIYLLLEKADFTLGEFNNDKIHVGILIIVIVNSNRYDFKSSLLTSPLPPLVIYVYIDSIRN